MNNVCLRKDYLDILRGIGIFYVILGHIVHISYVFQYIYSFHMPLFFFISGMLFAPSKYKSTSDYIKKKAKSLLIPYFFFYIVCLVYWYFVEYKLFGRSGDTTFLREFYLMFSGCVSIAGGPLWFLPSLFCVEILYWFVHSQCRKYQGGICAIIMAVIGYFCIHNHFCPQIFGLLQALVVIPFFSIGYLLIKKTDALLESHWITKVSIICVAIFIQYLLLDYSSFDIGGFELGNYYIYLPMAFSGIAFYLMLALIIKKNFILEWIGRNSLPIFAFHAQIYRVCIVGISICLAISQTELRENLGYSILLTFVTIIVMIPVVYVYNKWMIPLLLRK